MYSRKPHIVIEQASEDATTSAMQLDAVVPTVAESVPESESAVALLPSVAAGAGDKMAEVEQLPCHLCDEVFLSNEDLTRHILNAHAIDAKTDPHDVTAKPEPLAQDNNQVRSCCYMMRMC